MQTSLVYFAVAAAGSLTFVVAPTCCGGGLANLNGSSQTGVASGGLVLSATEDEALVNAGYVRIGNPTFADASPQRETDPTPVGRAQHTAVWTGDEMIVWGGYGGRSLNDGGRYDPVGHTWTAVTTSGAPRAREYHTAVWTGSEMIVWGGWIGGFFKDGGRYDPAANRWTAMTTSGAPAARRCHTAVWTGREMIVWGGYNPDESGPFNDGGRYDPAGNTWTAVRTNGAPGARQRHTAVWTGVEMIVWGGLRVGLTTTLSDGGRYDPAGNTWTAVTTTDAPSPRHDHTAVWTGSEMIVWGGGASRVSSLNDGGRYNPAGDSWRAVNTTNAPLKRRSHTAVWTGREMIVWGGYSPPNFNDGGRYDPAGDSWTALPTTDAPSARHDHTAVWSGSEMIVWGGFDLDPVFNDGGRYNPAADRWMAVKTTGPPPP